MNRSLQTIDTNNNSPSPGSECDQPSVSTSSSSTETVALPPDDYNFYRPLSPSSSPSISTAPPIPYNDLGIYIVNKTALTNNMKYKLLKEHYIPNTKFIFPKIIVNKQTRSFQLSWFNKYNGLVYSPSLQGGLCKFCVLFAKGRDSLGLFVTKPFTQFQNASVKTWPALW